MEAIYKPFLLLRKKKYAALNVIMDENSIVWIKFKYKKIK